MVKNKHIITALPLIASVLGRKYGVQVVIGGNSAHTDGKTIFLPSLPADGDDDLLNLARSFIDHESAHVRETDFSVGRKATPLEHYICNILEDWRVEKILSSIFPGCGHNLNWLARHFLLENPKYDTSPDNGQIIMLWLLLTVYSWKLPELLPKLNETVQEIEKDYPGLLELLVPVMQTVQVHCTSTQACLAVAQEIVALLHQYHHGSWDTNSKPENSEDNNRNVDDHADNHVGNHVASDNLTKLIRLINSAKTELPKNLGRMVAVELSNSAVADINDNQITVAVPNGRSTWNLDNQEICQTQKAVSALRARLHGVLQSSVLTPSRISSRGRLDTRKLHAFMTCSAKVFRQHGSRTGINTAVHILLDASGSMHGNNINLASKACYAVASALSIIHGVSMAVTAFPAKDKQFPSGNTSQHTVLPILIHKERMHSKFGIEAEGGTPMASAIWYAMVQMQQLMQKRKLILVITDGQPDSIEATRTAIQTAIQHGYELFGIGIKSSHVLTLMPRYSVVIKNIDDLPNAIFTMLQNALLQK